MNGTFNKNKMARRLHLKVIITLRKLLALNKKAQSKDNYNVAEQPATYRNIYYNSDIREATISDTFNGKTLPNATTLFIIIESMGYSLKEFTEIYEQVRKEELRLLDEVVDVREYFR